jgi:ATP-dependent protease HslVU (ClpYQ) ATPase subunit
LEDLKNGEMDESYCYLYVPKDVQEYGASAAANINNSPHNFENSKNKSMTFSHLKIKEIRNYMYEIYAEQLFKVIDIEEFVKSEIENKGIVVIDEIDKLVRG